MNFKILIELLFSSQLYYHLSKTLAEQAALKFAEEHKLSW